LFGSERGATTHVLASRMRIYLRTQIPLTCLPGILVSRHRIPGYASLNRRDGLFPHDEIRQPGHQLRNLGDYEKKHKQGQEER